jgi:predicted nucleotide-binding protein
VKQVKLSLGTADEAGGYPLMLELIGSSERDSDTVPRAHVEDNRPIGDSGVALDQEGIQDLLVRSWPSPGELQRVGDYLGGLLSYGAVGEKWADLRERFPRDSPPDSEGLGIRLDIAAPELRVLPWELARIGNLWAFTDPENPCARITRRFNPNPPPDPDQWPLRVTVIIGAAAGDLELKAEQELENLCNALDQGGPDVEYDVIEQPPRGDFLINELERLKPHVLHFIGRGESYEGTGALVMDGEEGRWDWTADNIVNTMPISPRIVALNACRSGDLRPQVGTWQVVDAFIQRGAYAVLAMQGDINSRAAATFNRGLYQALLEIPAIDVAVARGRRNALAAQPGRRDFCLPTLTLARPPDRVLPRRPGIGGSQLARSRRPIRAARIPPDLQAAITDPNKYNRRGAVHELQSRLASEDLPVAAAAYEALAKLARTDIQYVADLAAAALSQAAVRPEETELHFGEHQQGSEPPHRMVRLLGPPIARACAPCASHDWIHVNETTEGLDVSVDTTSTGILRGSLDLKGPTGEAVIAIDVELLPQAAQAFPTEGPSTPQSREQQQYAKQKARTEQETGERIEREPDTASASAAEVQAKRETRVQATAQVIEPTPGKSDSTGSHLNPTTPGSTTRIFLVHGHARAELHETVRVLERMTRLEVIVLREQPNAGRTILEKFEDSAAVTSYAVVLLTADDVGRASSASELQPRGRQNVIFELGFFFGRLGRDRVTVLRGEGVEEPSDIGGLVYITLDSSGAWKQELARELESANISVNYSRIP